MDPVIVVFAFLIAWFAFGCFASWVASQKERSLLEGFILGALFGPLGVLVEALLPSQRIERPRKPRFSEKKPFNPKDIWDTDGDDHPAVDDFLSEMKPKKRPPPPTSTWEE